MAEAAISALTEKLISLLSEEATLLQDIHEEVADIKDELESIQSFLKDADARAAAEEDMSEGVKTWVKQVKEVAFHMDVFMDEYLLEMAQHHPYWLQGFSWFLHKSARLFSMLKPHHETATKIQKIKESVQKIKARSERYGFQSTGQGSSSGTRNVRWQDPRKDSLYLEDTDVVGIESSRNELIGWLVEGQPHRIVISVVGMGGLGKTTLAKKIYDHQIVRGHFECYAWISVSQSYNIQDLLRSIMKQFREARMELPMPEIDTMDEQSLVNNQVLLNNVNTNLLGWRTNIIIAAGTGWACLYFFQRQSSRKLWFEFHMFTVVSSSLLLNALIVSAQISGFQNNHGLVGVTIFLCTTGITL